MSVPADRMRRRSSTVPDATELAVSTVPSYPIGTPPQIQTQPVARRSVLGELGDAVAQTPADIGSAVRDAVRDPVDALERTLAPLPGTGAGFGAVAGLSSRVAPLASEVAAATAASPAGRAVGQAIGAVSKSRLARMTGATATGALPFAVVDYANGQRDAALADDGTAGPTAAPTYQTSPRRRYRSTSGITQAPPGTENTFTGANGVTRRVQGGAATPEAPVERVTALGGNDAERFQLRGRQGGIIRNPDAMSTADRLRMIATDSAFKGSPSMRRLAAEAVLAEDAREDANFQGAQQENAAADLAQAQGQAKAREAFADRRLTADVANVENSERRREKDRDYQLGRADRFLKAEDIGARRRLAEAQLGAQANKRTDDLVTAEMARDPTLSREQAIVRANAIATLEGEDTQGSATGRAGDALAANALDAAVQRSVPTNPISRGIDALSRGAMNLYGSDLSAADDQFQRGATSPDAYDARGLTWRERLQSRLLPWRSPTDVVLTDRNGRNVQVSSEALGGLTPEEYNRRALLRRSTME